MVRRFVTALLAVTAALVAGVAAPARADAPVPWTLPECVHGTLSGVSRATDSEWFVVTGTATECRAPADPARRSGFGVAVFSSANGFGQILDWSIRLFPEQGPQWQPVAVPFGVGMFRNAGRHGVCVVQMQPRAPGTPIWERDIARPVACLLIVVTLTAEGAAVVSATEPLPVGAPMLARGTRVPLTWTGAIEPYTGGATNDGDGTCGTCF